jgi:hypothetical protein
MQRFRPAAWRSLFAAILLAVTTTVAAAQTTAVTGTITDPAGDMLSGSCTIQAVGPFSASNGWRVVGAPMVVKFSGGAFTAALSPTDSATPSGQYYKVTCGVPQQVVGGRTVGPSSWGPRYWLVPTNAQALDIGTVEITAPPPSPSWQILWQQMAQNGAQPGQAALWNGSSWAPGTPTAAAAWGAITGTLSNQADLAAALRTSYVAAVNATEYRDGFVTATQGSEQITGTNTSWTADMAGWWLFALPCTEIYQFTYISGTTAGLDRPWNCASRYGRYSLTQSTWVLASQHGLGTTALTVQCYEQPSDNQFSPAQAAGRMYPANVLIFATGDVEILWRTTQVGTCVVSR